MMRHLILTVVITFTCVMTPAHCFAQHSGTVSSVDSVTATVTSREPFPGIVIYSINSSNTVTHTSAGNETPVPVYCSTIVRIKDASGSTVAQSTGSGFVLYAGQSSTLTGTLNTDAPSSGVYTVEVEAYIGVPGLWFDVDLQTTQVTVP